MHMVFKEGEICANAAGVEWPKMEKAIEFIYEGRMHLGT